MAPQPVVPRMNTSTKVLLVMGVAVLIAFSSVLVDPVAATHTSLLLPSDPVIMEVFSGTATHFEISIGNVPEGYDVTSATYLGWCVDTTADMTRSPTIHQVRLYSSYDPPGDLAVQRWDMVNYILNHKQGDAQDIQEAIWYFVNFDDGYSPTSNVAWTIINDTLANGTDFVPRPGQIISIIAFPIVVLPGGPNVQVTVIELAVPLLVGDVTGSDGQPDGRVDMRDIAVIARHFGETVPPAPSTYDLNQDDKIDMRDIGLVARAFGDRSL